MKKIKLIACDMDGTLLNDRKEISSRNLELIHTLKERGVLFVVATGRHDSMIREYLEQIGDNTPVISCNGALIRDPHTGELFSSVPLESSQILEIIRICKDQGLDYHLYGRDIIFGEALTNKMYFYNKRNKTLSPGARIPLMVSEDYKAVISEYEGAVYKVLVFPGEEENFARISRKISDETGLTAFRSDKTLLDIMQKGITKARGMENLCQKLNIHRSETAAIGDYLNDLEMIRYAGVGVAMNNAVPELKDAAHMVTENCNNNSGVAEALERLVLID